jgi:hypothetical protein
LNIVPSKDIALKSFCNLYPPIPSSLLIIANWYNIFASGL